MKKFLRVCIASCSILLAITSLSQAASITGVYDFRDEFNASTTSFEGLDFTDDGTLWITSAPNNFWAQKQLIGVDLGNETVTSVSNYSSQFLFNPVGLASDGSDLFLTNNLKWSGSVYSSETDGTTISLLTLSSVDCQEPEGAAYLDGNIYVSCQDTQNVVKLSADGSVIENINFGANLLGLGATDDGALIVGDETNHALVIYDVATQTARETIYLADLFPNYEVEVSPGDVRDVPDPDGIAYRDGKIYMTFEHDLQVYEITVATPEPGTLLLIGSGLLALIGWKRKRS